ncbi:MAG: DUF2520 domain-containing protein [Bacteroidota bacterium]
MAQNIKVSIVGAGNVAWHLAPELDNAGFVVQEVYSRNAKNAEALVKRLYQAEVKHDLDFSSSDSNVFIVAVPDDYIEEVAMEIALPDEAILVHTSGSKPLSALGYSATEHIGVFYPLQTFSKAKSVVFRDIPICIETENKSTKSTLIKIAQSISSVVKSIDSKDRKALHVAAVFACNFTNHLFTISKEILNDKSLDFELLKPLIVETINKGLMIGPENAQTGPAKRGDMETLDHHMQYLQFNEGYMEIYKTITQHILDTYSNE